MGFGPAGRVLGQAFVDIRPQVDEFLPSLRDVVNRGLTEVEDRANSTFGRIAVSGAIAASVTSVENLQVGLREVITLGADTGPVATQIAGFTEDVQQLGLEFGVLTNESVPALYQALSAGVPRNGVEEFLETAQRAATAGVAELEASVSVLSASVNTFVAEGLTAEEASDLLFTAVRGGVTTFDELAASVGVVGPAAAAAGVEFREVTSAIAALTRAGISTSEASTQLRALFTELQTSSTEVAGTFAELSGQSFREFTAAGGDVVDALEILNDSAVSSGVAIGDLFGSVEASTAATVLASQDFAGFEQQLDSAAASAGATTDAFEIMNGSLTANLDRLRVFGQVARQQFGEEFLPIAEDLAQVGVELAPSVLELAESFGGGLGTVLRGVVIPALQVVTPGLEALATVVSAIPEPVFAAAVAYRTLFRLFTASAATNVAVAGLTRLSGALNTVTASTTAANTAAAGSFGSRIARTGTAAANTAGRMSTLASSVTRFGNALPVAGAAIAVGVPLLAQLAESSDDSAERVANLTDRITELGGNEVQAAIDRIDELTDPIKEIPATIDEALDEIENARLESILERLIDDIGDSDLAQRVGLTFSDLGALAVEGFGDEFRDVQRVIVDQGFDQALSTLEGRVSDTTISFVENARAAGLNEREVANLADAIFEAGSDLGDFDKQQRDLAQSFLLTGQSVTGLRDEIAQYAIETNTAEDGTVNWIGALDEARALTELGSEATAEWVRGLGGISTVAPQAESANRRIGDSFVNVSASIGEVTESLAELTGTYRDQFDLASDLEDANQEFIRGFAELREEFERFNTDGDASNDRAIRQLRLGTEAGDALRDTIQGQATALLDLVEARDADGASIQEQNDLLQAGREQIIQNAIDIGVSEEAVRNFIDTTLEVPTEVTLSIFTDTSEAERFAELLAQLPAEQQVIIRASLQASQDTLNFLNSGGNVDDLFVGIPRGAEGMIIPGSANGSLIIAGETGDNEVLINPNSPIQRQVELASESGLLANLQRAGALGGGVTVQQTIMALTYDERVLAQFAREAALDAVLEVGVAP